jgi:hypothetical protein
VKYSSFKKCAWICMMAQTLITHHFK